MTNFLPAPNADGLTKLSGTIRNLKVTRGTASFVFTESDRSKMGVIAIAAAMADMGGQAISTASNANATEEEADYLEFDLDGLPVKGWVWRNPFQDGDKVNVAAEVVGDYWEAYGVARFADKTIALYPHCSRGEVAHRSNAIFWLLFGSAFFFIFIQLPIAIFSIGFRIFSHSEFYFMALALFTFFAMMAWSLNRKWMPFVRMAEKAFRALELPNPSTIDLVKSSKAQRSENDREEYGTFYFRY